VVDVTSDHVILRNLAMPHSPRWHNGRLWFLNSAAGELCVVDLERGKYDVVCGLPGMLRGMWMKDDYAIVALSLPRHKDPVDMPRQPVQDRFDKMLCGLALVDLRSGKPTGLLQFTRAIGELYDVAFIPGVQRARLLSLEQTDEVSRACDITEYGWWLEKDKKEEKRLKEMDAAVAEAEKVADKEGPAKLS